MIDANFMWEMVESLASSKYYINDSEKPALLVLPKLNSKGYDLYLNLIGKIASFKSERNATNRVKKLVETANYPLKLYRVRYGRKDKKPFAVNEEYSELYKNAVEGNPIKVFNIEEWEPKPEVSAE